MGDHVCRPPEIILLPHYDGVVARGWQHQICMPTGKHHVLQRDFFLFIEKVLLPRGPTSTVQNSFWLNLMEQQKSWSCKLLAAFKHNRSGLCKTGPLPLLVLHVKTYWIILHGTSLTGTVWKTTNLLQPEWAIVALALRKGVVVVTKQWYTGNSLPEQKKAYRWENQNRSCLTLFENFQQSTIVVLWHGVCVFIDLPSALLVMSQFSFVFWLLVPPWQLPTLTPSLF